MPSPSLWSLFSLWLVAASAMLLMMLPGSAITHCIISLFITIVAAVLAYCGYLTVLIKAATIANLSRTIYHWLHQQALNDAIAALPGPPWLLTWLTQIAKQQHATVRQIGKMNKWHMVLHWSLCNISILIQASNPAPIITSLNTFTCDVNHFAAALYNIDGQLTTLANNLQRLENAIDRGYNHFQEVWLYPLRLSSPPPMYEMSPSIIPVRTPLSQGSEDEFGVGKWPQS